MFTKFLLCCAAVAILSIATESLADTYEVIEVDPRQLQQKRQYNLCQQYMDYYDSYYNQFYSKYYNDYYYNYYKNQYANQKPQMPNINLNGEKVEWVCTNPKTKNTMIIPVQVPAKNSKNGQEYYEEYYLVSKHPQQTKPPSLTNQQPNHQPPNYNHPPSHQNPPNYPPANPQSKLPTNEPQYHPQESSNQTPKKSQESEPNTNGDGIIDIRFGDA